MSIAYDDALKALEHRLSPRAVEHSVMVAETARSLAAEYGVDAGNALLAGLLHDWDRERSASELVEQAGLAGLLVTDVDRAVPYLLHARTGALGVKDAFPGIDDAVVQAIANHTVGSAGMSALDKVVYIADMIEPERVFDGVEGLRRSVGQIGLDELFENAYQRSVGHLVETWRRIHPNTVAVWNEISGGRVS